MRKLLALSKNMVTFTTFPCPFSVLAIALFIYYTSVPAGTEVKQQTKNKDVA